MAGSELNDALCRVSGWRRPGRTVMGHTLLILVAFINLKATTSSGLLIDKKRRAEWARVCGWTHLPKELWSRHYQQLGADLVSHHQPGWEADEAKHLDGDSWMNKRLHTWFLWLLWTAGDRKTCCQQLVAAQTPTSLSHSRFLAPFDHHGFLHDCFLCPSSLD